jgi:hypothetical protein
MFKRDKPQAARDLDQLNGDPWALGNLSDAPADPAERQHYAEQYDQGIATQLAHAGVDPSHPAFDGLYQMAVNGDLTHGVSGLEDGHELPMSKREAILYAPESVWRDAQAQGTNANALLAEYTRRNPDLAHDLDGMSAAVDVALDYAAERGERPMDNPSKFLSDVASFHRGGVRPQHGDSGRTAGIGARGGPAPTWDDGRNPMDDDQGMVGEIRALQQRRGW